MPYIAIPPIPFLHWWLYLCGSYFHVYLEASTSQIERFQAWMHIMHISICDTCSISTTLNDSIGDIDGDIISCYGHMDVWVVCPVCIYACINDKIYTYPIKEPALFNIDTCYSTCIIVTYQPTCIQLRP